ncbi:hypothetical protein D3C71_1710600 [compost metagenome]
MGTNGWRYKDNAFCTPQYPHIHLLQHTDIGVIRNRYDHRVPLSVNRIIANISMVYNAFTRHQMMLLVLHTDTQSKVVFKQLCKKCL